MLRKLTVGLRRTLVVSTMKLLTPKLKIEVTNFLEHVHRVPRPFTLMLKKHFGDKPLVGAEIGFGFGENSTSLLNELNIKKLYCVDPFILKSYYEGKNLVSNYTDESKSRYKQLKEDIRIQFVHFASDEGFSKLPEDLDFIYIDGNHESDFVLRDLNKAFNHIRKGSFVGGHDFIRGAENQIIKAVFEFSVEIGQSPTIKMPDFWFKKN